MTYLTGTELDQLRTMKQGRRRDDDAPLMVRTWAEEGGAGVAYPYTLDMALLAASAVMRHLTERTG